MESRTIGPSDQQASERARPEDAEASRDIQSIVATNLMATPQLHDVF